VPWLQAAKEDFSAEKRNSFSHQGIQEHPCQWRQIEQQVRLSNFQEQHSKLSDEDEIEGPVAVQQQLPEYGGDHDRKESKHPRHGQLSPAEPHTKPRQHESIPGVAKPRQHHEASTQRH
jgi:hypothetical protein